jgi:hypothetical protein
MLTIEAAIPKAEVHPCLGARASEYQRLLRQLHVAVNCQGQPADYVVKAMLRTHGWTARQLNAIKIQLEGMNRAWNEGLHRRIKELKARIDQLERVITKEKDRNIRHQRKKSR